MKKLLCCFFLLGCIHFASAQSIVKGKVADTLDKKNLQNAVVSLLQKSDSTLRYFTRTTKAGEFTIPGVLPDKYVLLVTYPGFADFADYIEVGNQREKDLETFPSH